MTENIKRMPLDEVISSQQYSDKEILQKMLNAEIEFEEDFYKKLISRMEADPEYQSYKTKKFKNSREMVEFYFPNDKIMHLDLVYGYDDAEFAYATMFLHGIIVEYDLDKALYWLKRAYHDNNKEAFGLIKTLMEENNMLEELKEFCICCARIYDDSEIKDYCAEHKIDYSKPSLKQDKLIKDYLLFYKRSPRNTTKRDRELIDSILTSQNENDTLKWIKELEPMADEKLARMFYSAKPYYDGYDYKDEICDESDPKKKQALMEKHKFNEKKQQAFWDCEKDLNLTEKEKLFMPRFVHDNSFLDSMEWNSPNLSQYVRHKTYYEQSAVEKVCYQMLDHDHNLSFESAFTIVNILAKKEEKEIESRSQNTEEQNLSPRDMVFYMGAYYKRAAVFEKYYAPTQTRTIEEIMYDHMLNCIVCETVVNALIPADIGAPMTWEAIKKRVSLKDSQEENDEVADDVPDKGKEEELFTQEKSENMDNDIDKEKMKLISISISPENDLDMNISSKTYDELSSELKKVADEIISDKGSKRKRFVAKNTSIKDAVIKSCTQILAQKRKDILICCGSADVNDYLWKYIYQGLDFSYNTKTATPYILEYDNFTDEYKSMEEMPIQSEADAMDYIFIYDMENIPSNIIYALFALLNKNGKMIVFSDSPIELAAGTGFTDKWINLDDIENNFVNKKEP